MIRKLKKILNTSKIWHAWTLDPLASGLLLIAVWEYTKILSFLLIKDKVYDFTINLDGESDSYDTGTPIRFLSEEKQQYFASKIQKSDIITLIQKEFSWKISQTPPKYSALKVNGEKALLRAKSWEDFELAPREVEVFSFEVLEYIYPQVVCRAHVSSGTYIRSFAYDLGKILWTGGYISSLRRSQLGTIDISSAQSLERFCPEQKLDETLLFSKDTFISIESPLVERLKLGQRVKIEANFPLFTPLFIRENEKLSLVVEYDGNILSPKKRILD